MKNRIIPLLLIIIVYIFCGCSNKIDMDDMINDDINSIPKVTETDLAVNGIIAGVTTVDEMKMLLGTPTEHIHFDENGYDVYFYNHIEYWTNNNGNLIKTIVINEDNEVGVLGINIGNRMEDVLNRFEGHIRDIEAINGNLSNDYYPAENEFLLLTNKDTANMPVSRALWITSEKTFPLLIIEFSEDGVVNKIQVGAKW
jgi:hypothetical protein